MQLQYCSRMKERLKNGIDSATVEKARGLVAKWKTRAKRRAKAERLAIASEKRKERVEEIKKASTRWKEWDTAT